MSFSLTPLSAPDTPTKGDVLKRLRAECEGALGEPRKGMLLHEIGVLEDDEQNDGQAARDLLSAVNAIPDFHEPLERLVVLIARRRSYKNLGKLLDRLVKIADTDEELSRALLAFGEYKEDQEHDTDAAREAFEKAAETKGGHGTQAWLALERLAARLGASDLRQKALAARADLTKDPTWKALLLVDLARLRSEAGDLEPAIRALEEAAAAKGAATFAALIELEAVAREADRKELSAQALESIAELIQRAESGATDEAASSVPERVRTAAHVGDAWLRASEIRKELGQTDRAVALLDRVVARLPDDPAAAFARLRAAEASGDTAVAAEFARAELARGETGPIAAALWMRVAEASASNGDRVAALEALARALAEDPRCIPARTLELHLLSGGEPSPLAQALETAAAQLDSDDLAAEFYLLSADTWARTAGDVNAAKAALSQAAASGASIDVVARTGRMLAALSNDAAWFEDATRRLLATNPPDAERPGLWFEIGRARLLRGDVASATDAFGELAKTDGGAWLGNALRAYGARAKNVAKTPAVDGSEATPLVAEGDGGAAALRALSDLSPNKHLAHAFRVASALRLQLAGSVSQARTDLEALLADDPSDLVAATALAAILRRENDPLQAAEALTACAVVREDATVAAALHLEAGILRWRAGERALAIESFEHGADLSPEAGSALFAWALRAAQPNDVAARRKALEAAAASEDPEALAVERFGLEAGAGGDRAVALLCLDAAAGDDPLARALGLGRALWMSGASPASDAGTRDDALDALSEEGEDAAAVARGSAHFENLESGLADAQSLAATAAAWAGHDASLAAALEWLGHATAAKNRDAEIQARRAVAERLPAGRAALEASAHLIARLVHGETDAPLIEGTAPETDLANLELAPPSCDPRRRAAALLGAPRVLDESSSSAAVMLAGWNLLAAGDKVGAIRAFRKFLEQYPEDIVGWEGLRAAAEVAGNKELLAEASAALGDLVSDAHQGAELWERAATLLFDDLGDPVRGEEALARAVARDVGRGAAFDRLFRLVRARRDGPRLLELISVRLEVAEDSTEIAKLYWERARALREAGDVRGALEALEDVTMLEPDHVGALALTGEIYISDKRFPEAAERLAHLSGLPAAPRQQRLMSGVAAVDLFENKLGQPERALAVLADLHKSGLSTLPVRERFARVAAKTESWDAATTVLEELMEQRETRAGRVEAARLAMVLYRDRLSQPALAERAVERLLAEVPDDGEALDLVLGGVLSSATTARLLDVGRRAVTTQLVAAPGNSEQTTRLSEIARQLGDVQLRQVTLGALVAEGEATPEILAELEALDRRVARVPRIAVDEATLRDLRDPEDSGPIPELMRELAPTLAEALGPGLVALGVSKKERVRPQDGLPLRNEVAAWAGALGLGEFELYVGGRDDKGVNAVATETPSIVLGANVPYPLSAVTRGALVRELLALRHGTTILRHRDPGDIAALVVAACNVAGFRMESPPYAMLGEFERQLSKELPRRTRKVLPEMAHAVRSSGADPIVWMRAARSSLDRMAAIAIGDVSWVLASGEGRPRGEPPVTTEGRLRAERLLSFVLSPSFFSIREKLGMGVK
jgi:tetratricopeptide (TPR) repeat protein